jgi:hypothetical protein
MMPAALPAGRPADGRQMLSGAAALAVTRHVDQYFCHRLQLRLRAPFSLDRLIKPEMAAGGDI